MSSKIESPGRYAVTVSSAFIDQTAKGAPYIGLNFETEDGLTATGYLWLDDTKRSDKDGKTCFERTDILLKEVFGFKGDYATIETAIKGKAASIECADETYNGKTELKVKFINAPRAEMNDKASFLKNLSAKSTKLGAPVKKAESGDTPF